MIRIDHIREVHMLDPYFYIRGVDLGEKDGPVMRFPFWKILC